MICYYILISIIDIYFPKSIFCKSDYSTLSINTFNWGKELRNVYYIILLFLIINQ